MYFKKKQLSVIPLVILLLLSGCTNPFMEKILGRGGEKPYTGPPGSGTPGDPFIVHDVATLQRVGREAVGWTLSASYKQVRNIDLKNIDWTPIGEDPAAFFGEYDGGGKTIANLSIYGSGQDYQGMFGRIEVSGVVKNLTLTNCYVLGSGQIGGLAGWNNGMVQNCTVSGSINGYTYVGTVVGLNLKEVIGCNAMGTVNGSYPVGGVAGHNVGIVAESHAANEVWGDLNIGGVVGTNSGMVNNCSSTGNISGDDYTGGVAGANDSGIIKYCHAAGTITGSGNVGGIVGVNEAGYGTISNCYVTGNAKISCTANTGNVGGIVGANYSGSEVFSCYVNGDVSGGGAASQCIGGIAGVNEGMMSDCYTTGKVTGSGECVGGIVGVNDGTSASVRICYATGTVSGANNIGGIVGRNGSNGIIETCIALNTNITVSGSDFGRVAGSNTGPMAKNYGRNDMKVNGNVYTSWNNNNTDPHGEEITAHEWINESNWTGNWDFVFSNGGIDIWAWNNGLPILRDVGGTQNPRVVAP